MWVVVIVYGAIQWTIKKDESMYSTKVLDAAYLETLSYSRYRTLWGYLGNSRNER
jgi:hypothetical protein